MKQSESNNSPEFEVNVCGRNARYTQTGRLYENIPNYHKKKIFLKFREQKQSDSVIYINKKL
jgi:hypothetical protein